MIANTVWLLAGIGRGPGTDVARAEPSHIHIPRPDRVMRHDGGSCVTRGALVSGGDYAAAPIDDREVPG